MPLSERACRYLQHCPRSATLRKASAVSSVLQKNGVPPAPAFLSFAANYSGYRLSVFDCPGDDFKACLIAKPHFWSRPKLDGIEQDGRYYLNCGDHATAPFFYLLSDKGEFCSHTPNRITVLASSFDLVVEEYALRNELQRAGYFSSSFYEVRNESAYAEACKEQRTVPVASLQDSQNDWQQGDGFFVHKGIWMDGSGSFLNVWANSELLCEGIIARFRTSGVTG